MHLWESMHGEDRPAHERACGLAHCMKDIDSKTNRRQRGSRNLIEKGSSI